MIAHHLYSGGKDSSLSAMMMDSLGHELKLVTATFGTTEGWKVAEDSAEQLSYDHEVLKLPEKDLNKCVELILEKNRSRYGIQKAHELALESLASKEEVQVISDGTRRDDVTPNLSRSQTQSLEDRHDIEYVRPLEGVGYKTINRVSEESFVIEKEESSRAERPDYEMEIREYMANNYGEDKVEEIFPESHLQSRVLGWK